MAAKTGKLTANGARKKKFFRRDFGDLKFQMGVGDVTSPIAVLGITDFGNNWGRGHGIASHQWEDRHQFWQVNLLFHFRRDLRVRGPIGSSKWYFWRGRRRGAKHSRGTPAGGKRGLKKGLRGLIGSRLGKGLTGICRSSNG